MPRKKLSEFRAKKIINNALGLEYSGWQIDLDVELSSQLTSPMSLGEKLVVKVDEGVKGRFKKGLVLLDVSPEDIETAVKSLGEKGYRWLIIEPMLSHDQKDERYLNLSSSRHGWELSYTERGGIDVEQNVESLQKTLLSADTSWTNLAKELKLSEQQIKSLSEICASNYFVFLEINPYVISGDCLHLLDTAVEVDDAAEFFVNSWDSSDLRQTNSKHLTVQEQTVLGLDANSPASFNLTLLEPNGSIFLLLSGGGASVVVADEVYNQGYGAQLANYGEYSGNPNAEETYVYTKSVLELLLKSTAPKKVLFIGGAVANFTDIAKTFKGVIQAITELSSELQQQHVKVFVRRGGPNQEAGLASIRSSLSKLNLLGSVHDPETPLTEVVNEALKEVSHE